jgi:hypothetical protein
MKKHIDEDNPAAVFDTLNKLRMLLSEDFFRATTLMTVEKYHSLYFCLACNLSDLSYWHKQVRTLDKNDTRYQTALKTVESKQLVVSHYEKLLGDLQC